MRKLTRIRAIIAPGLWALVLVFPASCGASLDANDAIVDQGGRLYAVNCASCHGASGEGQPEWKTVGPDGRYPAPPHDRTGHTWHHGDGLLFQIVKQGGASLNVPGFQSGMPAFGDQLSDDEVRSVLGYLKTLWGPSERAFQARVTEQERR